MIKDKMSNVDDIWGLFLVVSIVTCLSLMCLNIFITYENNYFVDTCYDDCLNLTYDINVNKSICPYHYCLKECDLE